VSGLTRVQPRAYHVTLYGLVVAAGALLSGCSEAQSELDFGFYRDNIEPMFVQSRGTFMPPDPGDPACVLCHTWQSHTPLMLESLEEDEDGSVYWTETQSRANFEVVSRLVTPGDPQNSRLLQAPLNPQAGGSALHSGGKVWDSQDDPEWQTLAEWVGNATLPAAPAESAPDVDVEFFQACVHPIFFQPIPSSSGLACVNCHSEEFTQTNPEESWNAIDRLIEPGQPTQSRLLMHPLHPDAGGDYVHNGVRRWLSQDDPEWQMLAAWVSGERTGSYCGP